MTTHCTVCDGEVDLESFDAMDWDGGVAHVSCAEDAAGELSLDDTVRMMG